MGTSVLLVFLAPVLAAYILFGGAFEAVFGSPTEKVVLPYDESKGIVWEYDDTDDPYINLKEVQIKGDEQIFVFENSEDLITNMFNIVVNSFLDTGYEGNVMDLVVTDAQGNSVVTVNPKTGADVSSLIVTDENGNTKTFYASAGGMMSAPDIFASEECLVTQYTVTAENPSESGSWGTNSGNEYVLAKKADVSPSATFTVVKMPCYSAKYFSVDFSYSTNIVGLEKVTTSFGTSESNELTVTNERRELYYTSGLVK